MNTFKKILAVLSLASMLGFIVSILVMLIGQLGSAKCGPVIYGFLTAFLALGVTALVIDYLQRRAAKAKAEQAKEEEK